MKKETLIKIWNQYKKRFYVGTCAIVIASSCLVGCRNNESKTPNEKKDVVEEVVDVDYLQYVKGLKDWTVEINTNPNFMEGVEWDEKYIVGVMCDSSKVDMAKEGEYDILYTVQTVDDDDVEVTKHCTVKVVPTVEADKLAESGQEVITDMGIQNKKESKASSLTDEGVNVKSEGNKVVVKKDDKGNISGSVNKPASKPSKPSGGNTNTSKPSGGTSEKPSKPSGGNDNNKPSKPEHTHKWEAVYQTINHPAEYKEVKHDAEYKTVNHPAEYQTINHPAEYQEIYHKEEGHYEKVKVKDAWDEPIYGYRLICKGCQAQILNDSAMASHQKEHMKTDGKMYAWSSKKVQTGTKHHDAVYENKWVVDKEAWTEKKLIKEAWSEKKLVKDAWTEKVKVKDAWTEKVKIKDAWTEKKVTGYKCSCGAKK